jgi:nonribosomal peptide synthetase MxcG
MSDVSSPLPLSAAQHGIWLGQQLDRHSGVYGTAECIELAGEIDVERLQRAIAQTLREADALNVRCELVGGAPAQRVIRQLEWQVPVQQLASAADAFEQVQRHARADLERPFDLERGPLVRSEILSVPGQVTYWYLAAHHIVLDGFGFTLVIQRAGEIYSALSANNTPKPSWFAGLETVLAEDDSYRSSADFGRDRAFWLSRFAGFSSARTLARAAAFPKQQALRRELNLAPAVQQRLAALARVQEGSWADALLAAIAALFHAETGADELVIGLPMMGRLGSRSLRAPSMCMNIVPLRLTLEPSADFAALIARVVGERRALRAHARYRYEDLRRDLKLLGAQRRLFGPVVNIMPFDHGPRFGAARARVHNLSGGPVEDLSIGVFPGTESTPLRLHLDANPAAYDLARLAQLERGLVGVIERWLEAPTEALATLTSGTVAAAPQRAAALLRGEALSSVPRDVALRVIEQAGARVALETIAGERLDYRALNHSALVLAAHLGARGLEPGKLVAVALPRGVDAVRAILAVLFAGSAYLPLDPEGPSARLASVLADAKPDLLITRADLCQRLPAGLSCECVLIGEERNEAPLAGPVSVHADLPAYVIYTSGSTGQPNGVVVSRGALAHFVQAALVRYGFGQRERILQFAPLHFDASVEEIFLALCAGATLVLRDENMLQSMPAFLRACAASQLSVLDLPTAFWHELSFALDTQALSLPACVRCVIIGGEAALPERVRRWQRRVGADVRLLNTYGPTEATVVALSAELRSVPAQDGVSELPIGAPLPGCAAAVLGVSGEPTDAGDVGELYLLGPALARGYLGRPQLERERFVHLRQLPGAPRAYRTGDLVRRLADGNLAFVGRSDDELKISGQRIDPREVEVVLLAHPWVRDAAVLAEHGPGGVKHLVAYIVASAEAQAQALPGALRAHAQQALLAAAVPGRFVPLEALPKTSSGKIDRRALAQLAPRSPQVDAAGVGRAPNALEAQLLALWREVLGGQGPGLADDIFELGVQSLQVIQLANRLSAQLGREVPATLLFDHPSVSELARALMQAEAAQSLRAGLPREQLLRDAELCDALTVPSELLPLQTNVRQVLLTGATGFVGSYLLAELLRQPALHVVCLVRADSDASARARLLAELGTRGVVLADRERVQVLAADLSKPELGLAADTFQRLAQECELIYHAAANISLARSYASLRASNVLGTREILRLAASVRLKPVHHVSSLAVAYTGRAGELPESYVALHDGLRDGYTQSKWVAEALAGAARARGVPVSVYRLGRVVGPRATARVQGDDIVWRMLRAGIALGALPELDVSEPWTPVDDVARAIVQLSRTQHAAAVYHVVGAGLTQLRQVFGWLRERGYALESCSVARFCELLRDAPSTVDKSTLVFFEAQAGTAPAAAITHVQRANTLRDLAGSDVSLPEVDRALVQRFFDACVQHRLFPAPLGAR